jgi:hypothetical protein
MFSCRLRRASKENQARRRPEMRGRCCCQLACKLSMLSTSLARYDRGYLMPKASWVALMASTHSAKVAGSVPAPLYLSGTAPSCRGRSIRVRRRLMVAEIGLGQR